MRKTFAVGPGLAVGEAVEDRAGRELEAAGEGRGPNMAYTGREDAEVGASEEEDDEPENAAEAESRVC